MTGVGQMTDNRGGSDGSGVESNLRPSAYQPSALAPGQAGSHSLTQPRWAVGLVVVIWEAGCASLGSRAGRHHLGGGLCRSSGPGEDFIFANILV